MGNRPGDFDEYVAPEPERSASLVIDTRVDFVDGGAVAHTATSEVAVHPRSPAVDID